MLNMVMMCNCGGMEWFGWADLGAFSCGWWKNMLLDGGRICLGLWKNMVWCDLGAFNCCVVQWKNMLLGGGRIWSEIWGLSAVGWWWKNMPLNGGRTCIGWKKMLLVVGEEAHFGYKIVFNAKWWMLDQNMDTTFMEHQDSWNVSVKPS
uniref:Candidate secreted effector n=1 Tax=Meloidogyne incognita TaxID=6306 RepID=A0A914M7F5_MELIC